MYNFVEVSGHNMESVESRNTTIQSEPFIRSIQDGCSDKTEAYKFWRIFSSLHDSPISAPNRLADLLTNIYIKCRSPQKYSSVWIS
jgi:hypothetical protein